MKRILTAFSLLLLLALPAGPSFGFENSGQDCSKCHTMSKDDAQSLLRGFNPNINVLEVKPGPVKGLWEVAFEMGGKNIVYFDFSKKYFISGNIIDVKGKQNLTQERIQEITKVDVAQIPLGDALLFGSKDAKHKLIVFDDPD